MSEPKRTSFTRYRRVSDILQADNLLRTKLSKTMAAVCRPDQSHKEFPIEVVYVTDEIHKKGLDAFTLPKLEVIRVAHGLLVTNPGPIPMPAPPPPLPAVPKAAPKAVKKVPPKPKVKPKVKPKRVAAPKVPATAEASPAAVEQKTTGGSRGNGVSPSPLKPPPVFVRSNIPYLPGVAALSNMQAAILLLEATGDSVIKPLIQKAQELVDELHRHVILPSAEKDVPASG